MISDPQCSARVATSAKAEVPVISSACRERGRKLNWQLENRGEREREVGGDGGARRCPSIWLTEGNAITVPQQYRPTKSLQVSDSWFPGLMRTSISVHRAACTCTPLAVSLKSSWCNHTETKSSHSIVSGGHNRKLKMNKSALDWCTFPEPFRARCDLFSVHECDAPECIPLLKLLLPEFNLTEANFGKCQDRHTAAEGGWLKGWGSAGRIWQWHLLTRCYRVEPLKNPLRERIS